MTNNAHNALRAFTNTIEATGGLTFAGAPAGDPSWFDLGDAYRAAKLALGEPVDPTHTVHDSATGSVVGVLYIADPDAFDRAYAKDCASPEGHVPAGRVLFPSDLESMKLEHNSAIFVTRI